MTCLLPDLWQLVAQYLDSHTSQLLSHVPGMDSILYQHWLLHENLDRMHRQASTRMPGMKSVPPELMTHLSEQDQHVLRSFYSFLSSWNLLMHHTRKNDQVHIHMIDPELENWTLLVDMARDWLAQHPHFIISPVYLARAVDRAVCVAKHPIVLDPDTLYRTELYAMATPDWSTHAGLEELFHDVANAIQQDFIQRMSRYAIEIHNEEQTIFNRMWQLELVQQYKFPTIMAKSLTELAHTRIPVFFSRPFGTQQIGLSSWYYHTQDLKAHLKATLVHSCRSSIKNAEQAQLAQAERQAQRHAKSEMAPTQPGASLTPYLEKLLANNHQAH